MQSTAKSCDFIDTRAFDKYDKNNQIRKVFMSEQNQLLSTRQAATLLGVSVRTIQLWVEQGLLSAWKTPGGHRRIVQESLLSLLHKRQKSQPLTYVLCVNLDADFFKLLQVLCQQWHFPVELQQARNAVDALLMMGEQKPELVLMTFEQQGIDMTLLQQELVQHQVKLALLSAEDPQLTMERIWLRLPFEPLQFKTELQKLLFARLQQAG
jgi:excisionase family DNA binding protein